MCLIKKFLDLGLQPLANKYLTKKDLDKTDCYLGSSFNNFSIIFLTDEFSKKLSQPCLNKILRLKALVVTSNGSQVFNEQNQEILSIL